MTDVTTTKIINILTDISRSPEKVAGIVRVLLDSDAPNVKERLAEFWTIVLLHHGELIADGLEEVDSEMNQLYNNNTKLSDQTRQLENQKRDWKNREVELCAENEELKKRINQRESTIEKRLRREIGGEFEDRYHWDLKMAQDIMNRYHTYEFEEE